MQNLEKEEMLLIKAVNWIVKHDNSPIKFNKDIDWKQFLELSLKHRIFPHIYKKFEGEIPDEYKEQYDMKYEKHKEKVERLQLEIENIIKITKENNIEAIIMKGIVLGQLIYDDIYARQTNDIDVLLLDDDILSMDKLLREDGYIHTSGWADNDYIKLPVPILKSWSHHEYFSYYKLFDTYRVKVELQRYLHQTIKEKEVVYFFETAKQIKMHNLDVNTFDVPHTFLSLCENAYYSAETAVGSKLGEYVDLYVFIQKFHLDWELIEELSLKYDMKLEVYYTLNYLNTIFDKSIDNIIINKFGGINNLHSNKKYFLWEDNFIDRLFVRDPNKLTNQLFNVRKAYAYSNENINYSFPYIVGEVENVKLVPFSEYLTLNVEKYSYILNYLPVLDKKGKTLSFYFILNEHLNKHFETSDILIDFIDPLLDTGLLYSKEVIISRKEGKILSKFVTNVNKIENWVCAPNVDSITGDEEYTCNELNINEHNIFEVNIPLDFIGQNNNPFKVAYNLSVDEKVDANLKQKIGSYILLHFFSNPPVLQLS